MNLSIKEFQSVIWDFYKANRRDFPWRNTTNPYEIMLSEIMLQQTQTNRVVAKYFLFLEHYQTIEDFAKAPFSEILIHWSGLGYNRRAKFLYEAIKQLSGMKSFPKTAEELEKLPGIGPYTSKAIATFAFDQRHAFLETNIRTVFIHFFFADQDKVSDKQLLEKVEQTLPSSDFRNWYYALMDYGNYLKSQKISHFEKQKHYTKQSKFKGSKRFVRGYILKQLTKQTQLSINEIIIPGYENDTINNVIESLQKEGFIRKVGSILTLT